MNGNTYFNFKFYNLLAVSRQQTRPGDWEAQALRESLGVRAADISWIVRGFSPPYFVPGYKKVLFFYKSRTCGGLKKTPSSVKYVTRVRPPSVPTSNSYPPPPSPSPGTVGQYGPIISKTRRVLFLIKYYKNRF